MTSFKERLRFIFLKVIHYDYWNIGLIDGKVNQLISDDVHTINWYRHQTKDSYLADPFILSRDGKEYVFVEEYDYPTQKGHISVVYDWNKPPRKIIDEPWHLSYPFLIEENGMLYMIPEASAGAKVNYYVCRSFPFEWEKAGTLLNEKVFDPTIFKWNEKFWLFYTKLEESSGELHIRYSDSIWGGWKEHPRNPVKVAPNVCRPAGPVFSVNNVLYRPSQDSAKNYGDNVLINEIIELTTETYKEELRKVISPKDHFPYTGMHHISYTDNKMVIDGRKTLMKWKGFRELIKTFWSGLVGRKY